jgi:hypothetical protein
VGLLLLAVAVAQLIYAMLRECGPLGQTKKNYFIPHKIRGTLISIVIIRSIMGTNKKPDNVVADRASTPILAGPSAVCRCLKLDCSTCSRLK